MKITLGESFDSYCEIASLLKRRLGEKNTLTTPQIFLCLRQFLETRLGKMFVESKRGLESMLFH